MCCLMFISREKEKAGKGFSGLCEWRKKGVGMGLYREFEIHW